MKYFLSSLLLILGLTITSYAQKCKFQKNETDPINGKNTRVTENNITMIWTFLIVNQGDTYSIGLAGDMIGDQRPGIQKGDTLFIKADGEPAFELVADNDYMPTVNYQLNNIHSQIKCFFTASREVVVKLSQKPITAVRLTIKNESKTWELKDKSSEKIMRSAACMLQ